MASNDMPFWKQKSLAQMTLDEWESLCDHCGKCCLHKFEQEPAGQVVYTSVACKLINLSTCGCTRYDERTQLVKTCLDLRQLAPEHYYWLPETCAYRLLSENKDLPSWHPLLTRSAASVKDAGVAISNYAIKEAQRIKLKDYMCDWIK